jgi:hypothetical protein
MMSAAECRMKASDAFARAASVTDPNLKLELQGVAREWAALAVAAAAQEALERNLVARDPD